MVPVSSVFPCNTCSINFNTSELQRSHMRQPWHISNLRRRISELPALTEEQYIALFQSQETGHRQKEVHQRNKYRDSLDQTDIETDFILENMHPSKDDFSQKVPATRCLFCNFNSMTLDENIDHMSSRHSLFIPSPHQLFDMESFLGYLAVIVFEYTECLYCGLEKSTIDGVQTHMRDKGHCMVNMSEESELHDFWDLSDRQGGGQTTEDDPVKRAIVDSSDTELWLPSGIMVKSRATTTQLRVKPGLAHSRSRSSQYRLRKAESKAVAVTSDQDCANREQGRSSTSTDHRLATRDEMGLAGVPESQLRALQVTERKILRREAVAKAARRYAAEQQPVKAMYYKTENPVYQAG